MAERPCKASDTSSDDHPASILYPVRQSPDRHPATPLPLTAPHKKGSLAQKKGISAQKKGISAQKKREPPHKKKGASGLNPEAPSFSLRPTPKHPAAWISS